jgi:hypothetical protein
VTGVMRKHDRSLMTTQIDPGMVGTWPIR